MQACVSPYAGLARPVATSKRDEMNALVGISHSPQSSHLVQCQYNLQPPSLNTAVLKSSRFLSKFLRIMLIIIMLLD